MLDGIGPYVGSVGKGVAIVLGSTVGAFFMGFLLASFWAPIGIALLLGVGVVQALWVVPLWLYYRRTSETETAKGMLIMASIVFLLNAGCWGLTLHWAILKK